jgi:hypothetical protein
MIDPITLGGVHELWLDFTHKVKKDKKKVWPEHRPFVRKYVSSDEEHRVLLMLLPKELIEELLDKEDPDAFIQQAIRDQLKTTSQDPLSQG